VWGSWEVSGEEEIEEGAKDTTLRNSCINWREVRVFFANFDPEVSIIYKCLANGHSYVASH
jgi:hypothetical protein